MLWELVLIFVLIVPLILLPVVLIQHKNIDSIFIASKASNCIRERRKNSALLNTK